MLNRVSGVVHAIVHFRSKGPDRATAGQARTPTSRNVHRRAIGLARFMAHMLTPTPRSRERAAAHTPILPVPVQPATRSASRRRLYRRHVVLRLTSDRTLPLAIGLIVLLAAGVSLAPAASPVGAAQGDPAGVRLVIGGGAGRAAALDDQLVAAVGQDEPSAFVDDGTLYKPVAVDTSIQSSVDLLEHYTVRDGDTLTGIANRFGVSMMTLWWANKITTKDSLRAGQDLIIPPVTGLVVTVKTGDTLDTIAAANKVEANDIVAVNGLTDFNLIVGQVLVLPGAKGAPIQAPKPSRTPSRSSGGYAGGVAGVAPAYNGGPWTWPVRGGGNYISQYFRSGHYAVDIAATYGTPVVAALAGTVVHAGWVNTGCGYSVVLRNSESIYTMYCHNSAVIVSPGQTVARGQQIARIGSSGWATGPHSHFAVSIGIPYESGSYFVNPLKYY